MKNFELLDDEVVLYEGKVTEKEEKDGLLLTLTSRKIVLEIEKGLIKKTRELAKIIELSAVKWYQNSPQIKQHGSSVEVQATTDHVVLTFSGLLDARKFTKNAIDATTGTTVAKRVSEKTKGALELVDDTLGLDVRGAIKGVLHKGVKGTLLTGVGEKGKSKGKEENEDKSEKQ